MQGSVTNFRKFKFYTRKYKFVHEQRYTPLRTQRQTIQNNHGMRSVCKKYGNQWEFKSMPVNSGNKLRKVTTMKSKKYAIKTLGSTSLQHESRCNVKLEKIDHVMGNKSDG